MRTLFSSRSLHGSVTTSYESILTKPSKYYTTEKKRDPFFFFFLLLSLIELSLLQRFFSSADHLHYRFVVEIVVVALFRAIRGRAFWVLCSIFYY